MTMQEIGEFIREVTFPVAAAVAGAWCLYKIGDVIGRLMVDTWKGKDARLAALERKVDQINNGQREALEKMFSRAMDLQQETAASNRQVAEAMLEQSDALRGFVIRCPLATDSDADRIAGPEPDEKTKERVQRRIERQHRREVDK